MKRTQFIEWGIIAIALIFGYKFLESFMSLLIQIIYGLDDRLITTDMLKIIFIIALYAAFFFLLVKNSNKIAAYVSPPDPSAADLAVKIGKRSMLQVILIAICALTILSNIADIIYYIFESFKSSVQRNSFLDDTRTYLPGKYVFVVKTLQVILAVLVIYLSKSISDLLIHKNEADELVFDSKNEN